MQIHELNDFTAELNDRAYLAIDNGSDTGKVSVNKMTDPINERIDNIITSPAPTEEEIVDARLGVNGTVYASLGAAIRAQAFEYENFKDYLLTNHQTGIWETGTILANTGANSSANNRIRSIGYVNLDGTAVLAAGAGYVVSAYLYNSGEFVGVWNGSAIVHSGSYQKQINVSDILDYDVRLVFKFENDASMTVSDGVNLNFETFGKRNIMDNAESFETVIGSISENDDYFWIKKINAQENIQNGAIDGNGNNTSTSGSYRTPGYIDVSLANFVESSLARLNNSGNFYHYVYFYTAAFEFIERIGGRQLLVFGEIPSEANYIRVSFTSVGTNNISSAEISLGVNNGLKNEVIAIQSMATDAELDWSQGGIVGGYIDDSAYRIHTGFVECRGISKFKITQPTSMLVSYILYDQSKNRISASGWVPSSDSYYDCTQAAYIRLLAKSSESDTTAILPEEGAAVVLNLFSYLHMKIKELQDIVNGSPKTKWYILGDSISAGYYSMTQSMAEAAGVSLDYTSPVTTDSGEVTGAVWDRSLNHNYWSYANRWKLQRELSGKAYPGQGYLRSASNAQNGIYVVKNNDFSDAGLITVAWGLNDWHYNMQRGDHSLLDDSVPYPSEDFDTSLIMTVNQAIWFCLGELIRKAPNARIVVQTPMNVWAYGGDFSSCWGLETAKSKSGTLADIHDDIIYWADYYGLQILDMTYNNSTVNRLNIKSNIIDGSHPSDDAHKQLGRYVAEALKYL